MGSCHYAAWLAIAVVLLFAGCTSTNVRTFQTETDTRQLTEAESRSWHAAEEINRVWQHKGLIYNNPQLTDYLQAIADRLYPEFKGTVRVQLIDSPELNAFALPNGNIYLNIGLVARIRNEAQLATVIGHEISHFTHQHSLKKRDAADTAAVAGMMVTLATGIPVSGQLLVAGAMAWYSIHAVRKRQDTQLIEALRTQEYTLAYALAAKGLGVDAKNPEGESALVLALKANQPETARAILKAKASAKTTTADGTPSTHLAAANANNHSNLVATSSLSAWHLQGACQDMYLYV